MATTESRLDRIERALTPKQAIIAWLERAQRCESIDEYYNWLAQQFEQGPTLKLLSDQMVTSILGRANDDLKNTQTDVRRAIREVAFLYFVFHLVSEEVASQSQATALWGILSEECVGFALSEAKAPTDPARFAMYQFYFRTYATEVFALDAAIEYLQNKYFDGHPILLKFQANRLLQHRERIKGLVASWNCLLLTLDLQEIRRKGKGKSSSYKLRELDFDLDALKKSTDPIKRTRYLVDRAKAKALDMIGDSDAALGYITGLLRNWK